MLAHVRSRAEGGSRVAIVMNGTLTIGRMVAFQVQVQV